MVTPTIKIIEGPDGVGKTTYIKKYVEEMSQSSPDTDVIVIRSPDNRDHVTTRQIIMSPSIAHNPSAAMYLFLADFMYAFDKYIKNAHYERETILVFDRFVPSVCIYQNVSSSILSMLISVTNPEFVDAFMDAEYLYLIPRDIEAHKARLAQKKGDEINHLDPQSDEAMLEQIAAYEKFINIHKNNGVIHSTYVTVSYV